MARKNTPSIAQSFPAVPTPTIGSAPRGREWTLHGRLRGAHFRGILDQ